MIVWNVLRAAGIGAFLMLFASVAWGLGATTSIGGKRIARASVTAVHQFFTGAGLLLLAIHLGGVLLDEEVDLAIVDLLIPLASPWRPIAITSGILAMYAVVVVAVSSWFRSGIGNSWWRRLHLLAAPAFVAALAHGILAGSDTSRPWMYWTYVATGAIVLFLLVVRAATARASRRAARATRPAGRPDRLPSPRDERSLQEGEVPAHAGSGPATSLLHRGSAGAAGSSAERTGVGH